ncbi:hypothetical protein GCM10028798_14350 [Humibacter antri]
MQHHLCTGLSRGIRYRIRVADVAAHIVFQTVRDSRSSVKEGRRRLQGKTVDPRAHPMKQKTQPRAFETGVARDQDGPTSPVRCVHSHTVGHAGLTDAKPGGRQ